MKKRLLSALLVLAMMLSVLPMSVFADSVEYSEQLTHKYASGFSEHFKLTSAVGYEKSWAVSEGRSIKIEATSDDIIITRLDIVLGDYGEDYNNIAVSHGDKVEAYGTRSGDTVHIKNVNRNTVEFTGKYLVLFDDITVHYRYHQHDDAGTAKPNPGGTHSYQCTVCEEYGKGYPHDFSGGKCECGAISDTIICETFRYPDSTESEHFSLSSTGDLGNFGWLTGPRDSITIKSKSEDYVIRAIDGVIGYYGDYYGSASFSDGDKVETGGVANKSTVHVVNIYDTVLKITSGSYVCYNSITVYYSYADEHTHNFLYTDNENGTHTLRCDGCGKHSNAESHNTNKPSSELASAATCTKAAAYYSECDKCGFINRSKTVSVGDPLPHTYPETWVKHDRAQHMRCCTVCGTAAEYQTHTWNSGEITKTPTENEAGIKTFTCTVCGETKDVAMPKAVSYAYYTANGNQAEKHSGTCDEYEIFFDNTTALEKGKWYIVNDDITVRDRIFIDSEANLILCDGATLNAEKGMEASYGGTINIFAQSEGTGKLAAQGTEDGAAIGVAGNGSIDPAGIINIHGGVIEATCGDKGAGIGGNFIATPKAITIYDGTIKAVGGARSAGIGGSHSDSGDITIYNGNITATGGSDGAGIGGGNSFCNSVTINGGTIVANGGDRAAGIGGGYGTAGGLITINGGDITAIGGRIAPGIGSGARSEDEDVDIDTSIEYDKVIINHVDRLVAKGSRALGVTADQAQLEGGVVISDELVLLTGEDENSLAIVSAYHDEKYVSVGAECPHKWDNGKATTPATHFADGVMLYSCIYCGETKTEKIERIAEHTFNQEIAEEKYFKSAATCTHADEYYLSCECGEASNDKTFTVGEKLEHNYKLTDNGDGTHSEKCSICGIGVYDPIKQTEVLPYMTPKEPIKGYIFNGKDFKVTATEADEFGMYGGWRWDHLSIESLDPSIIITDVDAVIGFFGQKYGDVGISSGEKLEKGGVSNGSTVHVTNINASTFSFRDGSKWCMFKDITVHYLKPAAAHPHEFVNGVCACGAVDSEALPQAKADAIARINAAKTPANTEIAEKAIKDIGKAESILAVNEICSKALEDMAAADLAKAKADVIAQIDALTTKYNKDLADRMKEYVNACQSCEEVEKFCKGKRNFADELKLEDARGRAYEEIDAAATEENADIAEDAKDRIRFAWSAEEVNTIKNETLLIMSCKRVRITLDDLTEELHGNVTVGGIRLTCLNGADLWCKPDEWYRFTGYYTPSFAFSLENHGEIAAIRTNGGEFSGDGWNGSSWTSPTGEGQLDVFANAAGSSEVKSIEIFYKEHAHTYDQEVAEEKYIKSEATCTEAAVYYKSCICGEASTADTFTYGKAPGHTWNDGEVTKAATHMAEGEKTYTCTACKGTKTEAIEKIKEHTFDQKAAEEQYLVSAATCTDPAVYYVSCECGEKGTETFTYGEALGHKWQDATCTEPKTCSVCKATEGEALGHTWGAWTSVSSTQHQRVCERDSSHMETAKHNFSGRTCADCGYIKSSVVPVTPVKPTLPFVDVKLSDWSYDDISYVWENGLMNGVSDTLFAPQTNTSRAMIVTILYRLEGEPAFMNDNIFADVERGSWYEKAVIWANGKGIVNGYGNGKFGPNDPITREQMAAILYRYCKYKEYDVSVDENTNFLSYTDFQYTNEYAMAPMMWAIENSILQGSNYVLSPQGNATREQVAAILHRFCEMIKK